MTGRARRAVGSVGASDSLARVARRVMRLLAAYEPPDFAHIPDPDAAIFLCSVDHRTGYREDHPVGGGGPLHGSELMWATGLAAARRDPGLLTASRLRAVSAAEVADLFRVDGDTVDDPERRAALWRDLARGLERDHEGSAQLLLDACKDRLGGKGGLLERVGAYEAYGDPLAKKAQLFAKICARRGWFRVRDPGSWEISADNVLMRLALRSGLVVPGPREEVRRATREAFKRVAELAGVEPPIIDDLLWERGRADPDLLGCVVDVAEPERDPRLSWY